MQHTYGNCKCGDWHSAKEFLTHFMDVCEGGNITFNSQYCDTDNCQACCPHDERDHGICLDCEHEEDHGAAIDRAMGYFED
jgi:hypothetical protein